MPGYNILLIIIDCLRLDRVSQVHMPYLHSIGQGNHLLTNYWSTSHCTDPSITSLLTGKWPDELRLYSMMYEEQWDLPQDIEMLPELAQRYGYKTGMISNLVRWYKRGVDFYVDNRNWHGAETFNRAVFMLRKELVEPWFMIVHDDSCHSHYRGGSYDAACREVDEDIWRLYNIAKNENTIIIVTSDHGEGLGERGIVMHGFGLWPFLTRIPLIIKTPESVQLLSYSDMVTQPVQVYGMLKSFIEKPEIKERFLITCNYAHMIGRTPDFWDRGVTDGKNMVLKRQNVHNGKTEYTHYDVNTDRVIATNRLPVFDMWNAARLHAANFGIDADHDILDDDILEERLRNLGYFE